jgi:hypothetical protein
MTLVRVSSAACWKVSRGALSNRISAAVGGNFEVDRLRELHGDDQG